jgi:proline iminopeptidase
MGLFMNRLVNFLLLLLSTNEQPRLVYGWISSNVFHAPSSTKKILHTNASPSPIADTTSTINEEANSTTPTLRELYSHWTVFLDGTLKVDDVHTLSFQVYSSNASTTSSSGLVGLFLHGGPGAACFPNHVRFFDPERYHQVILLDQRGCGKSTPTGCLTDNTLHTLVQDCEFLKSHLNIAKWDVVLGGSWGTTLAIAYAQTYPQSVQSIILRGIFLLRAQEVDWIFASTGGAAKKYPQAFEKFCQAVNLSSQNENSPRQVLYEYQHRLWSASNETIRKNAARSWMQWEFFNSVAYKIPPSTNMTDPNATIQALQSWKPPFCPPVLAYNTATQQWSYQSPEGVELSKADISSDLPTATDNKVAIEAHFRQNISNGYSIEDPPRDSVPITPNIPYYLGLQSAFSAPNSSLPVQSMLTCYYSTNSDWCRNYIQLLDPDRMRSFESIPCIVIQGGSDGVCPPDSALDLLQAWPEGGKMELRMPVHAGHSMYDPLITNELVKATDQMADFLLNESF